MRSTESVKEVDKRNLALDRGAVRNRSQVHNLLNAGLAEHRASGLATGVNIGMIAENGQRVAGNGTGRYVEYARKLLAGNLV